MLVDLLEKHREIFGKEKLADIPHAPSKVSPPPFSLPQREEPSFSSLEAPVQRVEKEKDHPLPTNIEYPSLLERDDPYESPENPQQQERILWRSYSQGMEGY